MIWICGRCKKEQNVPEDKAALAIFDDDEEQKICTSCIVATLGHDEEW